jgi:hypothetical protein
VRERAENDLIDFCAECSYLKSKLSCTRALRGCSLGALDNCTRYVEEQKRIMPRSYCFATSSRVRCKCESTGRQGLMPL